MATTATGPTSGTQSALDAALELRETISARAAAMEDNANVDKEIVQTLARAGVVTLMAPRTAFGADATPSEVVDVLSAISYADGSTGWVAMATMAATGVAATYLPQSALNELFLPGDLAQSVCAGTLQPRGRAVRTDDGYRLSGRFAFGSGSHHAQWMLAGFLLHEGEEIVRQPSGAPTVLMGLVPRAKVDLLGNWDVMGLRGTASYDYEVREHVAPFDFVRDTSGLEAERGELFKRLGPQTAGALGHAAFPLGVARRALDELTALVTTKKETPPAKGLLADRRTVKRDVAYATAGVRSAELYVRDAFERLYEAGPEADPSLRAHARLAASNAVRVATEAVRSAYTTSGTDALRNDSRLQRCFRDLHAASQHRLTAEPTFVDAADVLLGVPGATLVP